MEELAENIAEELKRASILYIGRAVDVRERLHAHPRLSGLREALTEYVDRNGSLDAEPVVFVWEGDLYEVESGLDRAFDAPLNSAAIEARRASLGSPCAIIRGVEVWAVWAGTSAISATGGYAIGLLGESRDAVAAFCVERPDIAEKLQSLLPKRGERDGPD